jgi:protease I
MKTKKVVIITGPGFEDPEVIFPYFRLLEEGYLVDIATSNNLEVKGKHGYHFAPTIDFEKLNVNDYQAVIIPGGNEAPDRVRQVKSILKFVKNMYKSGKIISSICHGPWVLISAGIIKGKKATCYPGMKDDLINSGAFYKKEAVVIDGNIITSDHPKSLGQWMKETLKALSKSA